MIWDEFQIYNKTSPSELDRLFYCYFTLHPLDVLDYYGLGYYKPLK